MSENEPIIRVRPASYEWGQVVAWAKWQIEDARSKLESPMVPVEKVPALRERIAIMKKLIVANEEK